LSAKRVVRGEHNPQSGEAKAKTGDPKSMAGRPKEKSKLLGQVFTPNPIAEQMVKELLGSRRDSALEILDPCVGPCTFPLAASRCGLLRPDDTVTAIDVDPEMIHRSEAYAAGQGINLNSLVGDYLDMRMDNRYDCAVLNPPYIRQEWLDKKSHYQELFKQRYEIRVPGTSNLYVYFVVKVLADLKPSGKFSCIIYDSWQSTLYGRWLLNYLRSRCGSLQVETKPGQPFYGRLIDATIITGVKAGASNNEYAEAGSEGSSPDALTVGPLTEIDGFCPIRDIFSSRRGLRLKQADFFLCDLSECEKIGAIPFLKKVRHLKGYAVPETHPEVALLVTPRNDNTRAVAELKRRLHLARQSPDRNVSILTWYRERPESWWLHREAPHAPLVFNYYLRSRPRHIFNPDRAYSDNFYGLTVPDGLSPLAVLAVLNPDVR
jgi:adenine-specific DNA-methyltransferase